MFSPYQEFIFKRTYARWLEDKQRRETWDETISRYSNYFKPRVPSSLLEDYQTAINLFRNQEIMGSMRALWTAGPALDHDNICGFNCAYTTITQWTDFAEILYILMNGTGVGTTVERQFINQLPSISDTFDETSTVITVEDSKEGWARAFALWLSYLSLGLVPKYDLSKVRPKGARLRTFGGRASGPEPLRDLFEFTKHIFQKAAGRKLYSDECADIVCKIADIVVVGGVRRSAILILSNPSDRRMAQYKEGEFWLRHPYRALANISACYTDMPDAATFLGDFLKIIKSGTGERGIVNREALRNTSPERRDRFPEYGLNPCGEVILRPKEFCNLTEVVARPYDDGNTLKAKIRAAVLLGCLQATLTDFQFISKDWKANCEEERLLGVSITGIMDVPFLYNYAPLTHFRQYAVACAEEFAKKLGIIKPRAVTCVKPSGTVSQLVNAASGIHPRYSPYYLRRVRVATVDPLAQFLLDMGVPAYPEVGQTWENCSTVVFEFPIQSPPESICRDQISAVQQLQHWATWKTGWCEHNPSVTIYVKDHEWPDVASWIYKHWNILGGITVLPYDGGIYPLAPYQEITEEQYHEAVAAFPKLDFSLLTEYEKEDHTEGGKEYACMGGACEL